MSYKHKNEQCFQMTEGLLLGLVQVEIEDVQSSIDMLSAFNILLEHSEVITQDTQVIILILWC